MVGEVGGGLGATVYGLLRRMARRSPIHEGFSASLIWRYLAVLSGAGDGGAMLSLGFVRLRFAAFYAHHAQK